MVTRPSRYPQVALTPGGNYVEPGSGVQLTGWPTGAIYPSSDANWLWRQITDWNRSHDASRLASTDILTATACQVSVSALSMDTGTGLTGVILTGGVYYGNGERIDLTDAATVYSGGASLVFPAGSTRYVCARPQPPTGGASNASSCAELIVSSSNPPAGYVTLLVVTTDGTDITAATTPVTVSTYLEWAVVPNFTVGLLGTTATLSGYLESPLGYFTGDAGGADTLEVTALGGGAALVVVGSSGGTAVSVSQVGARAAIGVSHTGSGSGAAIDCSAGSGAGLTVTAGEGASGVEITGSATSAYGLTVTNGTTYAVSGTGSTNGGGGLFSGAGTGLGVGALGGTGAGASAVQALARNSTGIGVYAQSHSTATTAARAGYFEGRDSAAGVEAISAGYHALRLQGDLTSPTYGTFYVAPQGAIPTNYGNGQMTVFDPAVANVAPMWCTSSALDATYRGVWDSPGGFAFGMTHSAVTTNANSAVYTTLCTVTMSGANVPRVSGVKVRISVSMRVGNSVGTVPYCDVQIRDTTAGSTITTRAGAGVLAGSGYTVTATTGDWTNTIAFDVEYTWPSVVASRSFVLEFKRSSGGTLAAQGSMTITGSY